MDNQNNTCSDALTAALKKSVQLELYNKKQCSYKPYECSQLSLNGYNYCSRHILNDKNAPFKQCTYTFPNNNGKKCHMPALRNDKKEIGYCNDHALKATLAKNRQNCKYQRPHTAEVILSSLSHYVKKPRVRTHSQQSDDGGPSSSNEDIELKVTKSLDPFIDIDAASLYNQQCNEVLGFCSESESDIEPSTLNNIWHDAQADSSDNESIDSEQEDHLKHANVYTAEEITSITRDKLIRLQSLYIEEYRHLQYLLKEKRRKYLHSLKREKETCCNISNQIRDNPKEQRLFKKLKAYNSYHKVHGIEAIFNKRLRDLRSKASDGIQPRSQNYTKCLYTEGGVKCGEKTLPLARHCRKHILEDPNQILFRSCGRVRADVECKTPVEAIFDDTTCRLHVDIPVLKSYNQTRKDSESDYEDPLENNMLPSLLDQSQLDLSAMSNIKSEFSEFATQVPKMDSVPSVLFEDSANDTNEEEMDNEEDTKDIKKEAVGGLFKLLDSNQNQDEINKKDNENVKVEEQPQIEMKKDDSKSQNDLNDVFYGSRKLGSDKICEDVESPMDIDDSQLDESTDTASEAMAEIKHVVKEP
ncbi:KAT8 regulatory NSL complex subunit 2 [Coccinella septempunctata]|uniref:KAT8 regulatory NSL complex subunit 2 n=1 Tax=Coccinella septempunctata TaxID=41139 RepID=UPI001D0815B2|nr:KAT8 regulatory NSL complex subunit 2 [Coccinella septempunctata]